MIHALGLPFCALALALALWAMSRLAPALRIEPVAGRFEAIDGLRGLAAFAVFLSHSAAWLYQARTGRWAAAPLAVYSNLGTGAVVLFFMITAFLFSSKLLDARGGRIDWLRLAVSRVLRLFPLYLLAIALLLGVVAVLSNFELRTGPGELAQAVSKWLVLTVFGSAEVNGVKDTWMIIAGVTWSLPYEVAFYLALPLLAVLVRAPQPRLLAVLLAAALAVAVAATTVRFRLLLPFAGGILAALLVRNPACLRLLQQRAAGWSALAALVLALAAFRFAFHVIPLLLFTLCFVVVAAGNPVFGVLTRRVVRELGEVSYSMYLLHGIVLFVVMQMLIGPERIAQWPIALYWTVVALLAPLLVALCSLSFVAIERPAMRRVSACTEALRRRGVPRLA